MGDRQRNRLLPAAMSAKRFSAEKIAGESETGPMITTNRAAGAAGRGISAGAVSIECSGD
jgi:hypothetical protein